MDSGFMGEGRGETVVQRGAYSGTILASFTISANRFNSPAKNAAHAFEQSLLCRHIRCGCKSDRLSQRSHGEQIIAFAGAASW